MTDYIPSKSRTIAHVHYPFLMGVLRVADYMEFRNSSSQYFIKHSARITSSVSQLEQATTEAFCEAVVDPSMEEIHLHYETITPDVEGHVQTYIKGIQAEVDITWAVLMEYYSGAEGPHGSPGDRLLADKGITVRRVEATNLASVDFSHRYFKNTMRISISGPSIIYLLAGPLYNNDPRFAIREILSNSHDACSDILSSSLSGEAGRIELIADLDDGRLSFRDNGVGMSIDDLEHYFLHVGGRIRDTLDWKVCHVQKTDRGEVSYAFASRFGVGVLSLFMLGHEIEVKTKREDCDGVQTNIQPDLRELIAERIDCDRGTNLSVAINEDVCNQLALSLVKLDTAKVQNSLPQELVFCISFLKYVPFLFDIHLEIKERDQVKRFTCRSVTHALVREGLSWSDFKVDKYPDISAFIVRVPTSRGVVESATPVIYNGVPIGVSRMDEIETFTVGDAIVIQDASNRISFNLQKTRFQNFDMELVRSVYEGQFETAVRKIARQINTGDFVQQSPLPRWLKYSSLERFVLNPQLFEVAPKMHDGLLPLVYFWNNSIVALTQHGVQRAEAEGFLILVVEPTEIDLVLKALVPEIPTIVASSDGTDIDTRIHTFTLEAKNVIRWKGRKGKQKDFRNIDRKRTYHDRNDVLRGCSLVSNDHRVLDHFLDTVAELELAGKCSGIGIVDVKELAHQLSVCRKAIMQSTIEVPISIVN